MAKEPSFMAKEPSFAAKQASFMAKEHSFMANEPSFAANQASFMAKEPSFVCGFSHYAAPFACASSNSSSFSGMPVPGTMREAAKFGGQQTNTSNLPHYSSSHRLAIYSIQAAHPMTKHRRRRSAGRSR